MAKRIYVGNLPVKAERSDLEQACSKHGEVTDVDIRVAGDRAQASISMQSGHEAAAQALDGKVVGGMTLTASVTIHHAEQDAD